MKMYDCVPGFEFDEKADLAQSPVWFLDGTHSVPPWTPMFGWFWINFCRHGMQYGAETLQLPTVHGWDWRFKDGGAYLTLLLVGSEEEKKAREAKFTQAIRPFVEDYDKLWTGLLEELFVRYRKIRAVDGEKATQIEILENFEYAIATCRRMWEIHMYMMYGTYTPFVLFEKLCKHLLNIDDTHPDFQKLMSGFDNESFRVDRGLCDYAQKIRDIGLEATLQATAPKDWEAKLNETEKGRDFLKDFKAFIDDKAGWRMERMAEICLPTWGEDLPQAFDKVAVYLKAGEAFDLEKKRMELEKQRKLTETELLAKVSAEQRGWFATLMKIAQNSSRFSEEHNHYLDQSTHALLRKTCIDMGKRFVAAGTISERDDIFFLMPDEVRKAGINPGQFNLKDIVARRRSEWNEWNQNGNPPVILREDFSMQQAMEVMIKSMDPIALKVVVGTMPDANSGLKADLIGTCGSAGVAEGIARLVFKEEDLAAIQDGDILVAVSTSPAWTPIFGRIKGVVVDRGGSLSHAAIVGREYGIPVIMNVFEGTTKIKSGQRIKIDANLGTVNIL